MYNSSLKSNNGHNLLKSVFPSNNSCFPTKTKITALIASLAPWECKQAIMSSQEEKQGIKKTSKKKTRHYSRDY